MRMNHQTRIDGWNPIDISLPSSSLCRVFINNINRLHVCLYLLRVNWNPQELQRKMIRQDESLNGRVEGEVWRDVCRFQQKSELCLVYLSFHKKEIWNFISFVRSVCQILSQYPFFNASAFAVHVPWILNWKSFRSFKYFFHWIYLPHPHVTCRSVHSNRGFSFNVGSFSHFGSCRNSRLLITLASHPSIPSPKSWT